MNDFETYLTRERGMTARSAHNVAESLAKVEALIGPGMPNAERERQFRRRARGTLSPDDIAECVDAMHMRAQYAD